MALFLALGGSAYAVGLGPNSVGTEELKAQAVERHDLGFGSVSSNKVENGALLGQDFAAGELPVGERGPQGEPGQDGGVGPTGPRGFGDTCRVDGIVRMIADES